MSNLLLLLKTKTFYGGLVKILTLVGVGLGLVPESLLPAVDPTQASTANLILWFMAVSGLSDWFKRLTSIKQEQKLREIRLEK